MLKRAGEFTAPNDPHLIVLVQLDPLAATFHLPSRQAARYEVGATVQVEYPEQGNSADAVVEYISPVIDAESGTVAIKVRVPNPDNRRQSGQACNLLDP